MAGLLDALNSRDGIFALGLLDAASPRPVRTNIGAGLLQALQGAQAWQQGQDDRAQRAALQALQMDHLRSQIAETLAQADQRKAATEDALRKAQAADALQQRQQQFLLGGMAGGPMAGAGGPSIMTGSGQRSPEQNAQVASQAQARGFDYATAAALFGPEHAAKLMQGMNDARNFGRDKVAGTVETVIPGTNMPGTMMRDEFGRPVGAVLPKAVEMKLQDLGGSVQAVNPFALTAGKGMTKTQTPDGAASNAVAWANNALARQRLAFDQQQSIGPKDKNLTDAQSKALLFGSRMQEADQVIAGLAARGTATQVPGANAGYGVGHLVNQFVTPAQQQLGQAKRDFINAALRRESGAVISEQEFRNAELQYFPQIGDSEEVIAQKARNRALSTRGILAEVPSAQRSMLSQPSGPVDLFKLPGAGGSGRPAQPGVIDWNSLGGR